MKKLAVILIVLLLILSGCYSYHDVSKMKDELNQQRDEEYFALMDEYEAKYSSLSDMYEKAEKALAKLYDEYLTLNSYFEDDDRYSRSDAVDAVDAMSRVFRDLGY